MNKYTPIIEAFLLISAGAFPGFDACKYTISHSICFYFNFIAYYPIQSVG